MAAAVEGVVIESGHVDLLDVALEGGELGISVHLDTGSLPRSVSPAEVQVRVRSAARVEVPDQAAYDFLGAPGSPVWLLPQSEDPDLVWPGWSTQRLLPGTVRGDSVTLRLVGVDGPGAVSIYSLDRLGVPVVLFDRGPRSSDAIEVPIRTHAHANWAFGAEGVHRLTFEASAVRADGTRTAATATYVVLVGDATPPVPWSTTRNPAVTPPQASGPPPVGPTDGGAPDAGGEPTSAGRPAPGAASSAERRAAAAGVPARVLARTGETSHTLALPGMALVAAGVLLIAVGRHRPGEPGHPHHRRNPT